MLRCIVVKVNPFINPLMQNPLTEGLLRLPTGSPGDSFNCGVNPAIYESSAV